MISNRFDTHRNESDLKSGFKASDISNGLTREQREHMIAEAAYYIAEHRNFQGGDPLEDWLQAQAEIDSQIDGTYRLRTD